MGLLILGILQYASYKMHETSLDSSTRAVEPNNIEGGQNSRRSHSKGEWGSLGLCSLINF